MSPRSSWSRPLWDQRLCSKLLWTKWCANSMRLLVSRIIVCFCNRERTIWDVDRFLASYRRDVCHCIVGNKMPYASTSFVVVWFTVTLSRDTFSLFYMKLHQIFVVVDVWWISWIRSKYYTSEIVLPFFTLFLFALIPCTHCVSADSHMKPMLLDTPRIGWQQNVRLHNMCFAKSRKAHCNSYKIHLYLISIDTYIYNVYLWPAWHICDIENTGQ